MSSSSATAEKNKNASQPRMEKKDQKEELQRIVHRYESLVRPSEINNENNTQTHHPPLHAKENTTDHHTDDNDNDDPLVHWLSYIGFYQTHFAKDDPRGNFLILERCVRALVRIDQYKNDDRFLSVCAKYADKTKNPNRVFEGLRHLKVGTNRALFWIAWAFIAEKQRNFRLADRILQKGIFEKAEPLRTLHIRQQQFQRRMTRHWLNYHAASCAKNESSMTKQKSRRRRSDDEDLDDGDTNGGDYFEENDSGNNDQNGSSIIGNNNNDNNTEEPSSGKWGDGIKQSSSDDGGTAFDPAASDSQQRRNETATAGRGTVETGKQEQSLLIESDNMASRTSGKAGEDREITTGDGGGRSRNVCNHDDVEAAQQRKQEQKDSPSTPPPCRKKTETITEAKDPLPTILFPDDDADDDKKEEEERRVNAAEGAGKPEIEGRRPGPSQQTGATSIEDCDHKPKTAEAAATDHPVVIRDSETIEEDHHYSVSTSNSPVAVAAITTKTKIIKDITHRLEKRYSKERVVAYGSLMNEVHQKVSSLYTGDHEVVETERQQQQQLVNDASDGDDDDDDDGANDTASLADIATLLKDDVDNDTSNIGVGAKSTTTDNGNTAALEDIAELLKGNDNDTSDFGGGAIATGNGNTANLEDITRLLKDDEDNDASDLGSGVRNITGNSDTATLEEVAELLKNDNDTSDFGEEALNTSNGNTATLDEISDLLKNENDTSDVGEEALNTSNANTASLEEISDLLKKDNDASEFGDEALNTGNSDANNTADLDGIGELLKDEKKSNDFVEATNTGNIHLPVGGDLSSRVSTNENAQPHSDEKMARKEHKTVPPVESSSSERIRAKDCSTEKLDTSSSDLCHDNEKNANDNSNDEEGFRNNDDKNKVKSTSNNDDLSPSNGKNHGQRGSNNIVVSCAAAFDDDSFDSLEDSILNNSKHVTTKRRSWASYYVEETLLDDNDEEGSYMDFTVSEGGDNTMQTLYDEIILSDAVSSSLLLKSGDRKKQDVIETQTLQRGGDTNENTNIINASNENSNKEFGNKNEDRTTAVGDEVFYKGVERSGLELKEIVPAPSRGKKTQEQQRVCTSKENSSSDNHDGISDNIINNENGSSTLRNITNKNLDATTNHLQPKRKEESLRDSGTVLNDKVAGSQDGSQARQPNIVVSCEASIVDESFDSMEESSSILNKNSSKNVTHNNRRSFESYYVEETLLDDDEGSYMEFTVADGDTMQTLYDDIILRDKDALSHDDGLRSKEQRKDNGEWDTAH